jgi:hypothetical protein
VRPFEPHSLIIPHRFFHPIDRHVAESLLLSTNHTGTFLLRPARRAGLCISTLGSAAVYHYKCDLRTCI